MTILDRVPNKRAPGAGAIPGTARCTTPAGRMHVGDWDGNPGQSCVVYLDQGRLYDFNGAQRGDLVDVIMHQQHCDATGARDWLDRGKWFWGDAYHAKDMPAPRPTLHLIDLPAAPPRTPLPEPGANGVVYIYRWARRQHRHAGSRRWLGKDGQKVIRRQRWVEGEWVAQTVTDCHGLKVQWWSWFEREWIWGRTDDARLPLYGLGELLRPAGRRGADRGGREGLQGGLYPLAGHGNGLSAGWQQPSARY